MAIIILILVKLQKIQHMDFKNYIIIRIYIFLVAQNGYFKLS